MDEMAGLELCRVDQKPSTGLRMLVWYADGEARPCAAWLILVVGGVVDVG